MHLYENPVAPNNVEYDTVDLHLSRVLAEFEKSPLKYMPALKKLFLEKRAFGFIQPFERYGKVEEYVVFALDIPSSIDLSHTCFCSIAELVSDELEKEGMFKNTSKGNC